MRGIVVACPASPAGLDWPAGMPVHRLPARPGKPDLDPLLGAGSPDGPPERVVVAGTDADLAAVVLRLLRRDLLREVSVGLVPAGDSAVARLWRLPEDHASALRVATAGEPDPVPLLRDDNGGVLVGLGVLGPLRGVAYCDQQTPLRGAARRIEVEPDDSGGPGLVVRVQRGTLLKRVAEYRGRAFQLGTMPIAPRRDGVPFDRAVTRWTWYRHTEDLRLARGLA